MSVVGAERSAEAQPGLASILAVGLTGVLLVLALATMVIAPFDHHTFVGWVGVAFMAATPTQIILGLYWHCSLPAVIGRLPQPAKGVCLTLMTVLASAVISVLVNTLVGGGYGPTPMLIQYVIMTIVTVLWLVLVWQCWPLSLLTRNPVALGVLTLMAAYFLAYVVWVICFDYSLLGNVGHPEYFNEIDPQGFFHFWDATTFAVTSVGVIVVHMLFDFWPINKLAGSSPQPVRGIIATLYVLALAGVIRWTFVSGLGFDQVDYMIRVPVCMIFGTFLVSNMMQFSLFTSFAQPLAGLLRLSAAIVAAVLMYQLYAFGADLHTGKDLIGGQANGWDLEIWIATAMLGVTFPLVFVVSDFFGFWPLKR